jgi:hypothetical protein
MFKSRKAYPSSEVEGAGFSRTLFSLREAGPTLVFFFVQFDAEGLEKLQILIADLEFGIGA